VEFFRLSLFSSSSFSLCIIFNRVEFIIFTSCLLNRIPVRRIGYTASFAINRYFWITCSQIHLRRASSSGVYFNIANSSSKVQLLKILRMFFDYTRSLTIHDAMNVFTQLASIKLCTSKAQVLTAPPMT
jgi:hypothetical protein